MVVALETVTYMALVPRCPLVAKDVMRSAEHHHVGEVVTKAQEPGVSRIGFFSPSVLLRYN